MGHPFWPLFDLRVRTPALELRLPSDDDLVAIARLAAAGIHDPDTMPFRIPWNDKPSPELEREVLKWGWRRRAELSPETWTLPFLVSRAGEPVGVQDLMGRKIGDARIGETGSWLGRAFQGEGIGKEMRAAVLHLAFAGLDLAECYSEAWHDNASSIGVSHALGYADDGDTLDARRDRADRMMRFKIDRATWELRRRADIVVEGLEPCLELLGVVSAQ